MHKVVTLLFLCFLLSIPVFAKTSIPAFDKARQIKMLESTRKDVGKIFADLKMTEEQTDEEKEEADFFETEVATIEVFYTSGDCSDEADDPDEWKIFEGKVKSIEISLNEDIKLEDLDFDLSGFTKEQKYFNIEDQFVHHDKNLGISFKVAEGEIKIIGLFPSKIYSNQLCENETGEELKQFYSKESYFEESELKDRIFSEGGRADVTDLTVSAKTLITECADSKGEKTCESDMRVDVQTIAFDPENDTLVYNYTVSGGTIIGTGSRIVWDLSDIEPGDYTITAGVDDGCGVCGATVTKTVTVKECSDCAIEDKTSSDAKKQSPDVPKQATDSKKQLTDEEKQLSDRAKQPTARKKLLPAKKNRKTV